MWVVSQQCGLANASRQGAPCEAMEMSYKHTSVNNFTNLPYPFGVYPQICEQQVDFDHTTTFRFCILFLDSWLLQNWLNCEVFKISYSWDWMYFASWLVKHGCGIGMFAHGVKAWGVCLSAILSCILNLPVWLLNQNMQCLFFSHSSTNPPFGMFQYKGCPCLNCGFRFSIFFILKLLLT